MSDDNLQFTPQMVTTDHNYQCFWGFCPTGRTFCYKIFVSSNFRASII